MPHYADGTEAKVGDKVIGKPYNTQREIVGQVIQVIPGTESCNLMVAFAELTQITQDEMVALSKLQFSDPKLVSTNEGKYYLIRGRYDYGEARAFQLLSAQEAIIN